jgi:hypothetical protein
MDGSGAVSEHGPDLVEDPWSGDLEQLRDLFIGREGQLTDGHHEHGHHDGGMYYHAHRNGASPHDHEYWCDGKPTLGGAGCFRPRRASESTALYQ